MLCLWSTIQIGHSEGEQFDTKIGQPIRIGNGRRWVSGVLRLVMEGEGEEEGVADVLIGTVWSEECMWRLKGLDGCIFGKAECLFWNE